MLSVGGFNAPTHCVCLSLSLSVCLSICFYICLSVFNQIGEWQLTSLCREPNHHGIPAFGIGNLANALLLLLRTLCVMSSTQASEADKARRTGLGWVGAVAVIQYPRRPGQHFSLFCTFCPFTQSIGSGSTEGDLLWPVTGKM